VVAVMVIIRGLLITEQLTQVAELVAELLLLDQE
jgi:hypothetical protein